MFEDPPTPIDEVAPSPIRKPKRPLSMAAEPARPEWKRTRTVDERPWYDAFPPPTMAAEVMPQRRAFMILSMKIASMLIVDVRRNDYEGGAIRGSINIPAQGFFWNRGILYELAYKADIEWVVFTCGSSNGRAPRCAGWFLEHVRNVAQDTNMGVMVLEGGVKGWVKSGPQCIQFMDGFQPEHWQRMFAEEANSMPPPPPDMNGGAMEM